MVPTHILYVGEWVGYGVCKIHKTNSTRIFIDDKYWKTSTDHDEVIKWKHSPRYLPFVRGIHRSLVNSPHKGQWRGALMFSLICAWINGWINNREASDLRRHRAPYNVTAILFAIGHSTCMKHHDPTPIPHIPSCKMSMVWILTLDVLIVYETCVFAFHILPQWNNSCSWYVSSRNVRFGYHALSKPRR